MKTTVKIQITSILRAALGTLAGTGLVAIFTGLLAIGLLNYGPLQAWWSRVVVLGFVAFFAFGTAFAFIDDCR